MTSCCRTRLVVAKETAGGMRSKLDPQLVPLPDDRLSFLGLEIVLLYKFGKQDGVLCTVVLILCVYARSKNGFMQNQRCRKQLINA